MHARRPVGRRESSRRLRGSLGHSASRGQYLTRLRVEPLEDRRMLSVLLVDADAPSGGDGLAWPTAYNDLQPALAQSAALNADAEPGNNVDQIWIAEGTYKPSALLEPADARSASFSLVNGVTLYGGFAGTEVTLDQRDWSAHVTTLSGDLGTAGDTADNAYTVAYCGSGIVSGIDGISITGGNANGSSDSSHPERRNGAGIFSAGTLTISDATVSGNSAVYGGGIYAGGTLTVIDSIVSGNSAVGDTIGRGGGIYQYYGTLNINGSTLSGNSAMGSGSGASIYGRGGGIYNEYGTLNITESTVSSNSAMGLNNDNRGGGVHCDHGTLSISDSVFSSNSTSSGGTHSSGYGGAICSYSTTVTINDSTFSYNSAGYVGGAIYKSSGTLTIANSTFWYNVAAGYTSCYAGAICSQNGGLTLTNSTLWGNLAKGTTTSSGGGIYIIGAWPATLNNTLVAGNSASSGSDIYHNSGTLLGSCNLIGDGSGQSALVNGVNGNQVGTTALPIDPMLSEWIQADNGEWGYCLLPGSPAVGAGNNALALNTAGQPLTEDIYGNPRILDGTVDIGAVEGATASNAAQTYTVTGLANTIANDGVLTFIEAFQAANRNQPVGDAPAGSFTEQDTIRFVEGLNGTVLVDDGELEVVGDLRIEGPGDELLTLQANHRNRVLLVRPGVSVALEGMTISGGSSNCGAGIYNAGFLAIIDSTVSDNKAISILPVNPLYAPILGNGAGICNCNTGTLTVSRSTISHNSATSGGGGIGNSGTLILVDSRISGNSALAGGGVANSSSAKATIASCTFSDNSTNYSGGAIDNSGTLTLVNSTFSGNLAGDGGAIYSSGFNNTLTVTNCTLSGNTATRYGGGIYQGGNSSAAITLNNAIVAKNRAEDGSDLYCKSGTLSGSNNLIGDGTGQTALVNGINGNQVGASASPIDPLLSHWTQFDNGLWGHYLLSGSPALDSGNNDLALDAAGQPLVVDILENTRIQNGTVDIGAVEGTTSGSPAQTYVVTSLAETIAEDGVLTFLEAFEAASRNRPMGNAPAGSFTEQDVIRFAEGLNGTILVDDGELAITGDLAIEGPGAELLAFQASGQNRVFFVIPSVLAFLDGITITGGSAHSGGGIYSAGVLTITDSVIIGNSAKGGEWITDAGGGGGICSTGTLTVNGCTLSDNSVTGNYGFGGAISGSGTLTLIDCAISGNSANIGGGTSYGGTLTLVNSTISHNSANTGGGICTHDSSSISTLNNTIVAGNTASSGPDVYLSSGTLSGSCNLVGDGSGQTQLVNGVDGNQVGTTDSPIDPLLSSAGRPLPGSPANNKGSNALAVDAAGNPLAVDLDGKPRIIYGTVDVGAYEYCLVADVDYSGTVDAGDAQVLASHWGLSDMAWTDGDFNDDGRVNAADAAILAANWGATFTPPGEQQEPADPSIPGENATPLVGPLPAGKSATARQTLLRRTKDEGRRTKDERQSTKDFAVEVSERIAVGQADARDAAFAEPLGPQSPLTSLDRTAIDRLAWARTLARRQVRKSEAGTLHARTAAIDLALADPRW